MMKAISFSLAIAMAVLVASTVSASPFSSFFGKAKTEPPAAEAPKPKSVQPASPTKPVVTRQTQMRIPFITPPGVAPVEFLLYLSSDRGAHWGLHARALSTAKHIDFTAPSDGEYWFALHTVTEANQAAGPPVAFNPQLIVVFDTTAPKIEFSATPGAAGEIRAHWRITEPNLDLNTVTLEYQSATDQVWRPVAIDNRGAGAGVSQGQAAWMPKSDDIIVSMRFKASDKAGNPKVMHRRVQMPQPGLTAAPTQPPTQPPPGPRQAAQVTAPQALAAQQPPQSMGGQLPPQTVQSTPWGVNHQTASSPTDPYLQRTPPVDTPAENLRERSSPRSEGIRYAAFPGQTRPAIGSRTDTSDESTAGSYRPPVGRPAAEPPIDELPVTSSRHFNLQYDLESVGPSGVSKVELWITNDGGDSWAYLTEDEDRQSPVAIEVDREGVYGFRIVVTGGNGLAGRRPAAGEQPDAWVGVDLSPPVAEIVSAPYGEGEQAGQLLIRWIARDQRLTKRPITLYYAEQSSGPWRMIASGLPNTGEYAWKVDAQTPRTVHLKIEVRDQAGHVAESRLPQAISIEGLVPRARVRGLAPIVESAGMMLNPFYPRR